MEAYLDFEAEVDADGNLTPSALGRLNAFLRGYARRAGIEDGQTAPVRLRGSKPTHSNKATRLYFSALGELARHLREAGGHQDKEGLHRDFKGMFLGLVASEALQETGEVVEYARRSTGLTGRVSLTLTTQQLSSWAFSRYLSYIDMVAAEYGCDLSEWFDPEQVGKLRSGRIEEHDGLDEVEYVETDTPGIYDVAPDCEPVQTRPPVASPVPNMSEFFEPTGRGIG